MKPWRMNIGLRVLLGYFLIVALAALLVGKVFVEQVKPGVRQAMEGTLIDTANTLAELATDDMLAGRIANGAFAQRVRAVRTREVGADISGFSKERSGFQVTVTDARGLVVFDSEDRDVGRDNSRWNDVYRTLRGQYGARSTRSDPDDPDSTVMHVAAPIHDAQGRVIGVLTVAKPNSAMAPFIARSQKIVARWGFVLMGAAQRRLGRSVDAGHEPTMACQSRFSNGASPRGARARSSPSTPAHSSGSSAMRSRMRR